MFVNSSSPLSPGGGGYLDVTHNVTSGSSRFVLSRQYASDPAAGVDLTKPHVVSFRFRLNSSTSTWTDSIGFDQLSIRDDSFVNYNFSQATTWSFGASSYTDGSYPRLTLFARGVNTGMILTPGVVYAVTVRNDPTTRSCDFTVDNGFRVFTATGIAWPSTTQAVGGFLNFTGSMGVPNQRAYSIDSISIAAVPEPASILFITVIATVTTRRRRPPTALQRRD